MNSIRSVSRLAIIVIVALFAGPVLLDAEPAFRSFISPVTNAKPSKTEDLPSLIKSLGSLDNSVNSHAVEALGKIGEPAVPSIIESLKDTNSRIRKGAADALGRIGNVRPEVVPALIRLLVDMDGSVRKGAAESLDRIGGPALPFIIKDLTDKNSFVRKGAADALRNMKTVTPEIVPALKTALNDSNGNVRKSVAEALEKRGAMTDELNARRYVLDLADTKSDSEIRLIAVYALNKIGPVTPEVMPAIISALADSDYLVRKNSAEFLDSRDSLPASLKAKRHIADLKYGNSAVRIRSLEILGKMGSVTPEVVPSMINALGDKDVRVAAIKSLGEIGPAAKSAVPLLANALTDGDADIRAEAAESLGEIGFGAKSAVPALMKSLKDRDSYVREKTAVALEKIGVLSMGGKIGYLTSSHPILAALAGLCICLVLLLAGRFAVPALWRLIFPLSWYIRELQNPLDERRALAVEALAGIGNSSIRFLVKMLENNRSDIRISATEALNEFRSLPPEYISLILKSLKDKEEEVRRNIVEVIGKNSHMTTETALALIRVLDDRSSSVRASAAEALGKDKSSDSQSQIIAGLRKTIEDSNHQVRESAAAALEKHGALTVELNVKRFIADLRDRNRDISSRAEEELDITGAAAIPELLKVLEDGNSIVRRFAASFLEKHDALTEELKVRRYINDLRDSNFNAVIKAAEALGNMGALALESAPHLEKLIVNTDFYIRQSAAQALEKMGALSPELKAKRHNLDLAESDSDAKAEAANALCDPGQGEGETLPI